MNETNNENWKYYNRRKNGNYQTTNNTNKILIIIFFIVLFFFLKIFFMEETNNEKVSLDNIKAPTQKKTSGGVTKTINGIETNINFIYSYSISGRVVGTQNYIKSSWGNILSPKDVGLSWGFLAREENHKKISWQSSPNRFLYWSTKDMEWLRKVGGTGAVNINSSNSHLIPSDEKTEKLISNIDKNDFIRIEGYLVNIRGEKGNKYYTWNSSTSRYDTGDGACEVVYVTDVVWLENE